MCLFIILPLQGAIPRNPMPAEGAPNDEDLVHFDRVGAFLAAVADGVYNLTLVVTVPTQAAGHFGSDPIVILITGISRALQVFSAPCPSFRVDCIGRIRPEGFGAMVRLRSRV
ncbi:hypothetical protein ZHAS_00012217 [Anopheles sinensis]|uniref:Uncharacterized protein n=1 Tax=Anopheles sinensis TaxID=74873 RepID=A0A084W2I9_ANOSI|nr:hypothetical protein ZHAS_00012217 [Anopheles sinensis]